MEPKKHVESITGKTLSGDVREYLFTKMSVKDGLRIFHEYGSILAANLSYFGDVIAKLFDKDAVVEKEDIIGLFAIVPKIFSWERVVDLSKCMLSSCTIQVNGKTFETDEDGMCELFGDDQGEFYVALFYAACINYKKYIYPFLELGVSDSNSTQEKGGAKDG